MLNDKLSNKEIIILFSSFGISFLLGILKIAISFPIWFDFILISAVAVYVCVQLYVAIRVLFFIKKNAIDVVYGAIGYILGMSIYYMNDKLSVRPIEESLEIISVEGGLVILSIMITIFSTVVLVRGLYKLGFKKK